MTGVVVFISNIKLKIEIKLFRERIGEARDELMRMLAEDELREAVLLIFANKQDLPNAMNAAEITDKLGLHSLRNRNWYIQVRLLSSVLFFNHLQTFFSRQPVQHQEMVFTKGWIG